MRLFLSPVQYDPNNGVGQILEAQHRYFPEFDIEFVDIPADADIVAAHIYSPRKAVDVLHNHGLLWTGDQRGYTEADHQANQAILETAKRAWAITVPSQWVAEPFKRDMRISPVVIPHGLNLSDWPAPLPLEKRGQFLLWNKNRQDAACDPGPAIELARRGLPVVSTFGDHSIMQVTGPMPHATMKQLLRETGVYLSTAKETFGIGILEALACGLPILGYAHGGILDLIEHKKTGYLVKPGDIDGLEAGYKWLLENRQNLQANISRALAGRDWREIMPRYVELYQEVLERKARPRKISVVITAYNYGHYVQQAVYSAIDQTRPPDEVIVVDDCSTDDTFQKASTATRETELLQVIRNETNLGVAASRNLGISRSNGDYIICLDADDYIQDTYVEKLFTALEEDRALGIAYTGLMMDFDTGERATSNWPPEFDFDVMARPGVPPPNAIPCAAMFRRDMWERAGGYRQQYAPGEDVEFWLRGLSVGFNARRVTTEPLFNYRMHAGSASRTKQYLPVDVDKPWTRNRAVMPMAAPMPKPNLVRSYSEPLISVIIPVGPNHSKFIPTALNSLLAQTFTGWEAIVIDDAPEGVESSLLDPYPFAKLLETHPYNNSQTNSGAGVARNVGIEYARAPLLFFLDADDWLMPTALEKMLAAYIKAGGGRYVYSDWYKAEAGQPLEEMPCPEYSQEAPREKIQHAVSILIEADQVRKVGGFDPELPSWEDWDFSLRLAAMGFCGVRVPEPLLIYRTATGTRRIKAFEQAEKLTELIKNRYKEVKFMSCCGGNKQVTSQAQQTLSQPASFALPPSEDGKVLMHYTGTAKGSIMFLGKYIAADDGINNLVNVAQPDVDRMLQFGVFELVNA